MKEKTINNVGNNFFNENYFINNVVEEALLMPQCNIYHTFSTISKRFASNLPYSLKLQNLKTIEASVVSYLNTFSLQRINNVEELFTRIYANYFDNFLWDNKALILYNVLVRYANKQAIINVSEEMIMSIINEGIDDEDYGEGGNYTWQHYINKLVGDD